MLQRLYASAIPRCHQAVVEMPKLVSVLPCNSLGTEQRHLAMFDLYFCARCAATARVWLCFSFCPWSLWRREPGVCAHASSSGNNNLTKRGIPSLNLFVKVSIQFKRSRKGMLKAKQVLLYQLCPLGQGGSHPAGGWDGSVLYLPCLGWQMLQVSPCGRGRGAVRLLCQQHLCCHPRRVHAHQSSTGYCSWWPNGVVCWEWGEKARRDTGTKKAGSFVFGQDWEWKHLLYFFIIFFLYR